MISTLLRSGAATGPNIPEGRPQIRGKGQPDERPADPDILCKSPGWYNKHPPTLA